MDLTLELKNSNEITIQNKAEIDEFIQNVIEVHKGNSAAINQLVMDSVTALTISEARSSELANQGFFRKLWGGITGKNQKIRADIDRNLAKSQYASQQMIQKLAEQNLLAFDILTAVNNKLNTLMIEVDEEINKIYTTLVVFFKQIKSDLIQLENRVDKLERNTNLLHWNTTIEYQIYDGVDYCELPNMGKIACIASDFYHITRGKWSTQDIMLLKSTLTDIGLPIKSRISSKEFYEYLIDKPNFIDRLLKEISVDGLTSLEEYQVPLIKGIDKLSKLQGEEKYLLDTVSSQLKLSNVRYDERDIKLSMIQYYLKDRAFMNTDAEVTIFDFVVELLTNINMINNSIVMGAEIEEDADEGEAEVIEEILYDETSKNERGNSTANINNGGFVAKQGDWIYYRNYKDCYKLYKVKTDESQKTKISDHDATYINIVGNWIYYINNNDKNIYKIKLNGNRLTKLNSGPSKNLLVIEDKVYYINEEDGKLYKMLNDGDEKIKITEDICLSFDIRNGRIYYIHENERSGKFHIYVLDINGKSENEICNGYYLYNVFVQGNYIYYNHGKGIFYLNSEKNSSTIISYGNDSLISESAFGEHIVNFNVLGDWTYFIKYECNITTNLRNGKFEVIKMRTDGSNKTMLTSEMYAELRYLSIIDDSIYFVNQKEDKMYKMTMDGSNQEEF
ncbi:DUF5050 domain-containing protein [Brassicibacter mesophilus]|uniref:DUF5050 domain-containing protein n=1 Tax=Brassicibacter mesophilus TaxID=745119 RepID=UPI003D239ADB